MPYIFEANEPMVSYMGITIYHVYKDNFQDSGYRGYWYTKEEYGCEDDDDSFDIRDLPDYDSDKSNEQNLVDMIRDGRFGPLPEDYDRYIDEDVSEAGVCPVCQSRALDYGRLEVQDKVAVYSFTCKTCSVTGNEYASLVFDGFSFD